MDIGSVLTETIEILWRRKYIWLLGLFMGINSLVFSLARPFLRGLFPAHWFEIDYWLNIVQSGNLPAADFALNIDRLGTYLLVGSIGLFVYVVIFWVVVTVSEGAIIGSTNEYAQTRPSSFSRALRLGLGYLKRFAAIDAAVFLPLFLWLVFMVIIALINTIGIAYLSLQTTTETNTIIGIYVVGWLCVLFLGCLIIPISFISVWFRTLAFRDAAILDHGVRESIRHTRQAIKQNFGVILVMTIILYGLSYLLGWLLSFLSLPLAALTAVPLATGLTSFSGLLAAGANLLISLLVAFLKGILHAFTAVAWTLTYRRLTIEQVYRVQIAEDN